MKRKIVIISILIILVIVLLLIPKDIYQKIFQKDKVEEQTETYTKRTLFVENPSHLLVGIRVNFDETKDETQQMWELLTNKNDTLPSGFTSPICSSCKLENYVKEGNVLVLNVDSDFLNSNGKKAIECLAWNFCNEEILEVVVKVDGERVESLKGYDFKSISKMKGVNLKMETSNWFDSSCLTIVHFENDEVRPVTYVFDSDILEIDYLVSKVFQSDFELEELVSIKGYSYEMDDERLILNLDTNKEISKDLENTLRETIFLNFDVSSFTLNGINDVYLQLEDTYFE